MSEPQKNAPQSVPVIGKGLLVPFILIAILFPLWGFANDITNPMVAAFKNILLISNFESSLVQSAFYGGYALMAIPAALFIKRFCYKSGILVGLLLYALGCLLFIPSAWTLAFAPFLLAYLVMTCGLSFLETTANPYILSLGDPATATRRLNFAQAFNPMGSILGMFVASMCILVNLDPESENARRLRDGVIADNTTISSQLAAQQSGIAKGLYELTDSAGWESNRKVMKRLSDQSTELANYLALLSNPKYDEAKRVSAEIANQPRRNKFIEAGIAVAEVIQVREKPAPTAAELARAKDFKSSAGLELALLLGREREDLAKFPELSGTFSQLAKTAAAAKAVSDKLDESYLKHTLPPKSEVSSELKKISADVAAASAAIGKIKADSLGGYVAENKTRFSQIQEKDLGTVVTPYAIMGGVLLLVFVLFLVKLPKGVTEEDGSKDMHIWSTVRRLFKNARYVEGVIAQTFYVGVQIMCWTFIIQYAELELGLPKSTAQNCNILAMVIFVSSRFICTYFLKFVNAGTLLAVLATVGGALVAGTIFFEGYTGLYCLIGVSACMSLMFPTIYAIALGGLGDDSKLGSAGLIMAIGGGSLMPPLQGAIIDLPPIQLWGGIELASVRASFVLPLICFVVIALYGLRSIKDLRKRAS